MVIKSPPLKRFKTTPPPPTAPISNWPEVMAATIVLEPATKTGVTSRPYFWKSFASMVIQKGAEASVRGVYGTTILRTSAALTGEGKKVPDNKADASNAQMS